jgi:hypothetical protein
MPTNIEPVKRLCVEQPTIVKIEGQSASPKEALIRLDGLKNPQFPPTPLGEVDK